MKILIPTASSMDVYMVRAAQEMGHEVHQLCMQDEWRVDSIRDACQADFFHVMPSRFEARMDRDDYKNFHRDMMAGIVNGCGIDVLLPTSSLDFSMDDIAAINDYFGLPGISPQHAEMFRDKANYLPYLASVGIDVPDVHEIVEPYSRPTRDDFPYPVIAKPGYGSGGFGVYVVDSPEKLHWLFGASDNPDGFSDRAFFNQDQDENGDPFCYVHTGFGGRYLIQDYMEGQCISLVGIAKDGELELHLAYDINVTEPPYCSEISFGYPSTIPYVHKAAERLTRLLEAHLRFPNGGWMADTIYKDGNLYLVDLSCRVSSSGTKMMYHTCVDRLAYPKRVIQAVTDGNMDENWTEADRGAFYSYMPFRKGKIEDVEYPEATDLIVEVNKTVEVGDRTTEMRNDVQVVDRGHVAAEADSRAEAEEAVTDFLSNITYHTA